MKQLPQEYIDYMQSPGWDVKRKRRLAIDNYTCQGCGGKGQPLDVHHLTYDNFGNERMGDLLSLCRRCHKAEHGERPRITFDHCRTCGEWLIIFIRKIKVLGTKWVEYTCQDGHIRSRKDE